MRMPTPTRLFPIPTRREVRHVSEALRTETIGGAVLIAFALAAVVWANTPWAPAYLSLREFAFGPSALHLHLTAAQWASDGLLAIFFFLAGLELKHEVVLGDLADPARAVVPIVAAAGGVVVPAGMFVAVVVASGAGAESLRGWAVPTATDIAFALAVLAVIGTHLPSAMRSFLLTLAVVDDLIAITIIACFYTTHLSLASLAASLLPLAAFAVLVQRRISHWWLLVPLAVAAWALVHASGVHATVAGIVLGLLVPVRRGARDPEGPTLAERLDERLRPFSAGVAVPLFALMAAGVPILGGGLSAALRDPVAIGIGIALVIGKPAGVLAGTWIVARFTRAELAKGLAWADVVGLSLLTGIGFTVSLLIGELAYGTGSERDAHAKLAVLAGSMLAALVGGLILRGRNRAHRGTALRAR